MYFDFNLKSSLLLVFFFHGLVFAVLLFKKSWENEDRPSFWLGIFTLLCCLYISPFMLGYAGWYSRQPYRDIMFYIPFQQLFLLPPVLFLYIKSLLDKTFVFSGKLIVHFLPAIAYFVYSVVVFATDKLILNENYFYADEKDKDLDVWYQVAGFILLVFYVIKSLTIYFEYKTLTYNATSFASSIMFGWAKKFLLAISALLGLRLLFFALNPEWDQFGSKFWYYICFSVLFYYVSIFGYFNSVRSVISLESEYQNNQSGLAFLAQINYWQSFFGKSKLDNANEIADLDIWKNKIESLMNTEKPYENPQLLLSDICSKLNVPQKKASLIINQTFNMNFNDFVNQYRTFAVIEKMGKGVHNTQTLLSIALDCGFNSKSTFNRAFKKQTGLTPKEYVDKHQKKIGVKSRFEAT